MIKKAYLLALIFLFIIPAHAAQTEPGKIDFVDAGANLIVINDRSFKYLPYVKVYGTTNQPVYTPEGLREGMIVALKFGVLLEEEGKILEIYLLD